LRTQTDTKAFDASTQCRICFKPFWPRNSFPYSDISLLFAKRILLGTLHSRIPSFPPQTCTRVHFWVSNLHFGSQSFSRVSFEDDVTVFQPYSFSTSSCSPCYIAHLEYLQSLGSARVLHPASSEPAANLKPRAPQEHRKSTGASLKRVWVVTL
jgi:hypothetical protein